MTKPPLIFKEDDVSVPRWLWWLLGVAIVSHGTLLLMVNRLQDEVADNTRQGTANWRQLTTVREEQLKRTSQQTQINDMLRRLDVVERYCEQKQNAGM